MNMATQPAARRPHVFSELPFCSRRKTSCRTSREARWSHPTLRGQQPAPPAGPVSGSHWTRSSSLQPVLGACVRPDPLLWTGVPRPPGGRPRPHSPGPTPLTLSPELTLGPEGPLPAPPCTGPPESWPWQGGPWAATADPPGSSLGTQQRSRSPPAATGGSCYACHLRASRGFSALLTAPSLGGRPGRTHKDTSPLPLPPPWLCLHGGGWRPERWRAAHRRTAAAHLCREVAVVQEKQGVPRLGGVGDQLVTSLPGNHGDLVGNSGSEPRGHLRGARACLAVCQGSRGPRPPSPCLRGPGEALPLCCSLHGPREDPGGRG